MKNIFLEAEKIYLRPLEIADCRGDYVSWLNDENICRYNSHHVFPYTLAQAEEYVRRTTISKTEIILAIVARDTDQHIGNISLQQIDLVSRNAEIAWLIGNAEYHGQGIGKAAGELMLRHGFKALGLHRIYCGTFAGNLAMQKVAAALGMREEGRLREAFYNNGGFVDVIEYGILRSEFEEKFGG